MFRSCVRSNLFFAPGSSSLSKLRHRVSGIADISVCYVLINKLLVKCFVLTIGVRYMLNMVSKLKMHNSPTRVAI